MGERRWEPTLEQQVIADRRAREQTDALPRVVSHHGGLVGRFSPVRANMTARRLRLEAERELDPTSILDDEPGDVAADCRSSFRHSPPVVVLFGASTFGSSAGFARAQELAAVAAVDFQAMVDTVNGVQLAGTTVDDAVSELGDATAVPAADVVNQRRHGSAAVCPRHGETKGGLCRKCRR